MDEKILLLVAGLFLLWIGAAGVNAGEVGLTIGIVMPSIKFKRDRRPGWFWGMVALYLLAGVGLIVTAVCRFAMHR